MFSTWGSLWGAQAVALGAAGCGFESHMHGAALPSRSASPGHAGSERTPRPHGGAYGPYLQPPPARRLLVRIPIDPHTWNRFAQPQCLSWACREQTDPTAAYRALWKILPATPCPEVAGSNPHRPNAWNSFAQPQCLSWGCREHTDPTAAYRGLWAIPPATPGLEVAGSNPHGPNAWSSFAQPQCMPWASGERTDATAA